MYNHTSWPHVCPHCSEVFDAPSWLDRHISSVHGSSDPHVCSCGKRFNSVSLLKTHMHIDNEVNEALPLEKQRNVQDMYRKKSLQTISNCQA